jgi:hypothetical protein
LLQLHPVQHNHAQIGPTAICEINR